MYAFGSTIDSLDERLERAAVRLRGRARQLVEVGPDLAGRAGRLERVAAAAAVLLEDREPGRRRRSAAPPRLAATSSNVGLAVTIVTWLRMSEWPRPQSSVQITGKVPIASA